VGKIVVVEREKRQYENGVSLYGKFAESSWVSKRSESNNA
jgi:hypothetical protein